MNKYMPQSPLFIFLSPLKILNQIKLNLFFIFCIFAFKLLIPFTFEDPKFITYAQRFVFISLAFFFTASILKIIQYIGTELIKGRSVFSNKLSPGIQDFILKLIKGFVVLMAILMVLDSFGVTITPILASLGIGSLAIALALQDTLGNLFSGVYLIFDQPFQEGDYIKVEDASVEGVITKIGWRSTRILMIQNNTIIIPNSKLSSSVLINYFSPTPETNILIPVSVAYESDLKKVEKITLEVAKKVLSQHSSGVTDFEPVVRFHTFASSSIDFNVTMKVKNYLERFILTHEFIKNLKEAYDQNGIEIPYPHQVQMVKQKESNGF